MARFLLIHGSCHGAWCWGPLIRELTALGHDAGAIDLPGCGQDRTPADQVTLGRCAERILQHSSPDTILVGHSWAGFPISAAAERDPAAMRALIYLCAYVPVSGLSMIDMRRRAPRQTLTDALRRNPAGTAYTIAPDRAQALFYHDCPPDAVALALRHLGPQPIRPQAEPLIPGDRHAGLPRRYIRCTGDRVIPPEYQQSMTAGWPADHVHDLGRSHSPFLADPGGLARLLDTIEGQL